MANFLSMLPAIRQRLIMEKAMPQNQTPAQTIGSMFGGRRMVRPTAVRPTATTPKPVQKPPQVASGNPYIRAQTTPGVIPQSPVSVGGFTPEQQKWREWELAQAQGKMGWLLSPEEAKAREAAIQSGAYKPRNEYVNWTQNRVPFDTSNIPTSASGGQPTQPTANSIAMPGGNPPTQTTPSSLDPYVQQYKSGQMSLSDLLGHIQNYNMGQQTPATTTQPYIPSTNPTGSNTPPSDFFGETTADPWIGNGPLAGVDPRTMQSQPQTPTQPTGTGGMGAVGTGMTEIGPWNSMNPADQQAFFNTMNQQAFNAQNSIGTSPNGIAAPAWQSQGTSQVPPSWGGLAYLGQQQQPQQQPQWSFGNLGGSANKSPFGNWGLK